MNPGISAQNLRLNNANNKHDSCQLQHSICLGMISCGIRDRENLHWGLGIHRLGKQGGKYEVGETPVRDWGMVNQG